MQQHAIRAGYSFKTHVLCVSCPKGVGAFKGAKIPEGGQLEIENLGGPAGLEFGHKSALNVLVSRLYIYIYIYADYFRSVWTRRGASCQALAGKRSSCEA